MNEKVKIRVFGVGGAGGHTTEKIGEKQIPYIEVVSVNTDAMALLDLKAAKKLLIGKELTGGTSTGADAILGDRCARADREKIIESVGGSDIVFITAGLGGGTGSGAAPVIAEYARLAGALTISIVTLPFSSEGKKILRNAEAGLKSLKANSDAVVVLPNEKLLELSHNAPIEEAFRLAEDMVSEIIGELSFLIYDEGLVNLGVSDLKSVFDSGRTAYVGIGRAPKPREASEKAMNYPLMDAEPGDVAAGIINITSSGEVESDELDEAVKYVSSEIPENATLLLSAQVDESMPKDTVRALIILSTGS